VGGLDREDFLMDPKEWRVLMELSEYLVLVGAGGGGPLAMIASFHIPVDKDGVDTFEAKEEEFHGDGFDVVGKAL
jgi:hypothetical protein